MEASRLIASFGRYVDNREATVLVGAGLSLNAGYPDWSGLLQTVREKLQQPDLNDLPLLAQYFISEYSETDLQDLIRQKLELDPLPQPTRCHELLAALPLAEIWTTNYDDLIERAMEDGVRTFVKDDDLAQREGSMGCRVYKMHGSLTHPSIDLPKSMSDFANQLGAAFAETSVALSAGASFGAQVGYALLKRLQKSSRSGLHAERFELLRRSKDQPLDEPSHRFGSILFQGRDQREMRDAAFGGARAVLAIGGGDGTAEEIKRAREDELGVVPIGKFGGSALEEWTRISKSLKDYRLGGLPVDSADFKSLRDGNSEECARAAARLAVQALYIRQEE